MEDIIEILEETSCSISTAMTDPESAELIGIRGVLEAFHCELHNHMCDCTKNLVRARATTHYEPYRAGQTKPMVTTKPHHRKRRH